MNCFFIKNQAVLGTRIKVKTLTGEKEIDVKPSTSHGDKMKLKGLVMKKESKYKYILIIQENQRVYDV